MERDWWEKKAEKLGKNGWDEWMTGKKEGIAQEEVEQKWIKTGHLEMQKENSPRCFWFIPGLGIKAQFLSQLPEVSVSLGGMAQIPCNYSVTSTGLFWYKQSHGTALHVLISEYDQREKGRLKMKTDKPNKSMELSIDKVELEDAAVYYCAMRDTVRGNVRGTKQKPAEGVAFLKKTFLPFVLSSHTVGVFGAMQWFRLFLTFRFLLRTCAFCRDEHMQGRP